MFGCGKNMKVILYDEDKMKCFGGYLSGIETRKPCEIDVTTIYETSQRVVMGKMDCTAEMTIELNNQIIQLDPTTMKRIARFNLEKENEELVKEIERHKKKIEALKAEYRELNDRLQSIRDIGADIWENGAEYKKDDDDWEF